MKITRKIFTLIVMLSVVLVARAEDCSSDDLPMAVFSGDQGKHHVQGIAYDARRRCMYMSFTTSLVKLDLQGHVLARVTGLTGHLGCLALDAEGDRLYASLEYKHDVIGTGVAEKEGVTNDAQDGFYVASFDLDAISELEMDASCVMKTVYLPGVVADYHAKVQNGGREWVHRLGCSGIDGMAVAPRVGKGRGARLYVAYGIYSEVDRADNDYQVLLCYDLKKLRKYEAVLDAASLHHSGPAAPEHIYYVYTGNTSWGIQNLTYDPSLGCLMAAVYPGKKRDRENFDLFAVDLSQRPRKQPLVGVEPMTCGDVLPLVKQGRCDARHNVWGWHFPYGTTGLCALGDGLYYVSHNARNPQTGQESCVATLYRWSGDEEAPLVQVER